MMQLLVLNCFETGVQNNTNFCQMLLKTRPNILFGYIRFGLFTMHTPIRRCLQALTRQSQPTLSLFKDPSSLRSLSVAAFPNHNISSPLLPIFTNSKPTSAFGQWHHGRYFSSSKQDDHIKEGCTHEIEDEDDDNDSDDDYDEEEGDYEDDDDDTVAISSRKKVYTAEEKEAEAEAIGYKVVGPLQKNDNVFKPYEPAFAVVQVQFANFN
jgi:large subunit ribosomal protein L21